MTTAPFWIVTALVLAAIDFGARASPLRAGYLTAGAVGCLAAGLVALLGQAPGVQLATAGLAGAAAFGVAPRWMLRRARRRLPEVLGHGTIAFDDEGVPWVDTPRGAMVAELMQRGELSDGLPVAIITIEPPVAYVHPLKRTDAPPPPPLSRCGTLR